MALENQIRPKSSRLAKFLAGIGFFLLYFPLVTLVIYSFLIPVQSIDSTFVTSSQWSLEWYRKLAENSSVLDAFFLSLEVGFWCTVGATVLGTSAALALTWSQFPGRKIFDVLTYIPLIMPEIVLGLALLIWFVLLNVTLGLVSIILAHITFSISYVIMTVKTRLDGFDPSYIEAARDLGASPWQTFWKVTFPIISPGVLSGALMAFTLSFDDFLITFFTAGAGSDTLPLKIYSMIKFGVTPEINALSTLMLGVTLVGVFVLFNPLGARK